MPLFSHERFKRPKATPRKFHPLPDFSDPTENIVSSPTGENNDLNVENVTLQLGSITSVFKNGNWHPDFPKGKDASAKEIVELRTKIEKLEEQNNMLHVKNEVLLNTVTLQKIQIDELEKENENLRRIFQRSSSRFGEDKN